ncbi:MAG: hypothetical protein CMN87_12105 [Stappia sp.]|uniref:hypothetical protein n=1 Tax=Stappia sp. TaxID=1870903 RepID=UPI000C41479F|nr:hypothetical protein [Stappia sp.]MAB00105.1 hypothetical protein [Stappia sp.]MBM20744.1 hypothetical protein [Stappia sp.]
MSHVRTQIIGAVVAALTGLSTTGANVFPQRRYPTGDGQWPCLLVYRGREVSTPDEIGRPPREMARTLEVLVEIVATGAHAEDVIDDACVEIEQALAADVTLGGLAMETFVSGYEPAPLLPDQPRQQTGAARLTLNISYRTTDADPETAA